MGLTATDSPCHQDLSCIYGNSLLFMGRYIGQEVFHGVSLKINFESVRFNAVSDTHTNL